MHTHNYKNDHNDKKKEGKLCQKTYPILTIIEIYHFIFINPSHGTVVQCAPIQLLNLCISTVVALFSKSEPFARLFFVMVQIETQLRYCIIHCMACVIAEKKTATKKANTEAKQVFFMELASFAIFSSYALSIFNIHAFNRLHFVFFFFTSSSRPFVTYSFTSMENMFMGTKINAREEREKTSFHAIFLCAFWANKEHLSILARSFSSLFHFN